MALCSARARLVGWMATAAVATASVGHALDTIVLDEVVVSAEAPAVETAEVHDRTAAVTVIRAESFQGKATAVPEVLERSVGLTVRRFGGLGAFATASIRGSSAQQVAVLLDGVPVAGADTGWVNLSNLPLGEVERIEVYRGTAPLRLRSPAIGGVINVVTRRARPGWHGRAEVTYGSFDTLDLKGLVSWKGEAAGFLVSAGYTSSDGDFEFLDDNGTRANSEDDEVTARRNNAFYARNLLARATWEPSPTLHLEVWDDYFDKREGVPGIGSNQSERAHLRTYRNVAAARIGKQEFLVPDLEVELSMHRVDETTAFYDPLGEIGVGRQDNVNENVAWGGEGVLTAYVGEVQALSFLAAYREERSKSWDERARVTEGDPQERRTLQFGAEDEIYLFGDRLLVNPQALYTRVAYDFGGTAPFSWQPLPAPDDEHYWSYKLGATWEPVPGLRVRANVGRYFRLPTLAELFGDRGGVVGNPELVPEKGVNWDIGFSWDRPRPWGPVERLHLEAGLFQSLTDDLILFVQTSQRTVKAINVSSARVWGVETAWSVDLAGWLAVQGNYTYQHTENTSEIPYYRGNQLPGRPAHELFNRVEVRWRILEAFHEFSWTAQNYLDAANFEKAESRQIHNVGLRVRPRPWLSVTAEAKNLTDEQVVDALGFPLPGRSYYVTVSAEM